MYYKLLICLFSFNFILINFYIKFNNNNTNYYYNTLTLNRKCKSRLARIISGSHSCASRSGKIKDWIFSLSSISRRCRVRDVPDGAAALIVQGWCWKNNNILFYMEEGVIFDIWPDGTHSSMVRWNKCLTKFNRRIAELFGKYGGMHEYSIFLQ